MENIIWILGAGIIFALLIAAKKKSWKHTLLWILIGYLILLGITLK